MNANHTSRTRGPLVELVTSHTTHSARRTNAAKSVQEDPNVPEPLDNPNPTEFWMSRGYNICCA